jgi:hypothetical protein
LIRIGRNLDGGYVLSVFKNLPEAPENLNGGLIPGVGLPPVLEITFINKAMGLDSSKRSSRQYPVEGLDFPNMKGQADIPLDFGKP